MTQHRMYKHIAGRASTFSHTFAGMSTFSTKGGLYERAQKRFNVTNGKRLFTYNFYEKRKLEALVCAELANTCLIHQTIGGCCFIA